eukprot:scaffold49252_cov16-Tisochrysis_lutea.AAC.1
MEDKAAVSMTRCAKLSMGWCCSVLPIPFDLVFNGVLFSADEFRSHFQQYGPVAEAQIMVDYNSGRSRGFGCAQRPVLYTLSIDMVR